MAALLESRLERPITFINDADAAGIAEMEFGAGRARIERRLDWPAWSRAVNEVLAAYHALLWPDLFIIGGGVTENWSQFGHLLEGPAEIARARRG